MRRFNSAIQTQRSADAGYTAPGQGRASIGTSGIRLQLQYRPPYDWEWRARLFARHAVAGVERADAGCYHRKSLAGGASGQYQGSPGAGPQCVGTGTARE